MRNFTTPEGVISYREGIDHKAIAHMEAHGSFMPSDMAIMRLFIHPNDQVIDVGANAGAFTVPLSRVAGEVIAFEPIPETADLLDHNLKQNDIKNVKVFRIGLSDKACNMGAERNPDPGSTSLTQGDEITVVTLNMISCNPSLIKIDVEGMEELVLRGAQDTLRWKRPVVFFEVQKGNMRRYGSTFKGLAGCFPRYRFLFNLRVEQDGKYLLGTLPYLGILRFASGTLNVLAVPREDVVPALNPLSTLMHLLRRKLGV